MSSLKKKISLGPKQHFLTKMELCILRVTCSEFPHGYSDGDSFTFMKSLEKAIPTSAKAIRGFFDRTRKPGAKCNCPEWALQKLRDHITLMESTSV